jgi:hypothetical protein
MLETKTQNQILLEKNLPNHPAYVEATKAGIWWGETYPSLALTKFNKKQIKHLISVRINTFQKHMKRKQMNIDIEPEIHFLAGLMFYIENLKGD